MNIKNKKICIIGLGYVGLPLAVAFAKKFKVIGFDINQLRIQEVEKGHDSTLEVKDDLLSSVANNLSYSSNIKDTKDCNIYIITVPSPIDKVNRPNLIPLIDASKAVGTVLSKNDIVIYESTVYPGATEDVCVPELERSSGMKFNKDFFCGYSPERVNPGDKVNTLEKIKKITSGSTKEIADEVDKLYKTIITAGTHLVSSIKVAEAAKVIENTQRDLNIALVNEFSVIFQRLDLDTLEVLEAAGSKWNFLPFRPGIVGGHCIGVDPYYLTHKAQQIGHNPEIILAGRRINDNMGIYVANQVVKLMIKKGLKIDGSEVLVLGVTFKENCPDIRNSKVIDVISELEEFGCNVSVSDCWADSDEVFDEYGIKLTEEVDFSQYQTVVVAVAHNEYKNIDLPSETVVFDIKSVLKKSDARL